mgnify:CR=1 FL=1
MSLQHPVVCEQIGARPIYIGSSRAASEGVIDETFDEVITVSSYSQPRTTTFIPLTDGQRVEYEMFKRAVEKARDAYSQGKSVLVHCEVGISRSASVIAAVLAAEEGATVDESLTEIKRYRQRVSPRRPLRECAERYISEKSGSDILVTV